MCPYYLDGDLRTAYAALGDTRVIGYCAVFKVREEVNPAGCRAGLSKLNSMRTASRRREPRSAACRVRSTLLEPIALEESAAAPASSKARWPRRRGP